MTDEASSSRSRGLHRRETVSQCRDCGCRDIRVAWTYRAADGSIRRRRICRHCGLGFTTVERELRDVAVRDDRGER